MDNSAEQEKIVSLLIVGESHCFEPNNFNRISYLKLTKEEVDNELAIRNQISTQELKESDVKCYLCKQSCIEIEMDDSSNRWIRWVYICKNCNFKIIDSSATF